MKKVILLAFIYISAFTASTASAEIQNIVNNTFEEYPHALKNPLKGFAGWDGDEDAPDPHIAGWDDAPDKGYSTLRKVFIPVNKICDSIYIPIDALKENIKTYIKNKSKGFEKENIKVYPIMIFEKSRGENFWPYGLEIGDYSTDEFYYFTEKLIEALAYVSEDSEISAKIAFVQMGILGEYGEITGDFLTDIDEKSTLKRIATMYKNHFSKKQVLLTGGGIDITSFYDPEFGVHWDSFMSQSEEEKDWAGNLGWINSSHPYNNGGPRWKSKMIVGEVAYNYGVKEAKGLYLDYDESNYNPDEAYLYPWWKKVDLIDSTLENEDYYNYLIKYIREYHVTSLAWISNYRKTDATSEGADAMQKALGYRFVLEEVSYPLNVTGGSQIDISFKIRNDGSAPFYYDWPLEISLVSINNHEWIGQLDLNQDVFASMWPKSYEEGSKTYNISATVPDNIDGEYYLSFSIIEPVGWYTPTVRFANKNYFYGGTHPVGKIGINHKIYDGSLDGTPFDSLKEPKGADTNLRYYLY